MNTRYAIAVSVAVAVVLSLGGCSRSGSVESSAPDSKASATEVSGGEAAMGEITTEQIAFTDELVSNGVDEVTAAEQIESAGFTYRVVMIEGEGLPATMDYRTDRINLTLENGIVVDATWG